MSFTKLNNIKQSLFSNHHLYSDYVNLFLHGAYCQRVVLKNIICHIRFYKYYFWEVMYVYYMPQRDLWRII